jgi:alkyl hydroperoxide reductase subunit AhpF
MATAKKPNYNPRASIEKVVAKLRKGALGKKLKEFSDEELFDLVLSGYEAGSKDALDSISPQFNELRKSIDAQSNLGLRLATLEGKVVKGKPGPKPKGTPDDPKPY